MNETAINEMTRKMIWNKVVPQMQENLRKAYLYPIPAFKNHKKSTGVGQVLNFLLQNPGKKPSEIREALKMRSQHAEFFTMMRKSGMINSEKGHYYISQIGQEYLSILPD